MTYSRGQFSRFWSFSLAKKLIESGPKWNFWSRKKSAERPHIHVGLWKMWLYSLSETPYRKSFCGHIFHKSGKNSSSASFLIQFPRRSAHPEYLALFKWEITSRRQWDTPIHMGIPAKCWKNVTYYKFGKLAGFQGERFKSANQVREVHVNYPNGKKYMQEKPEIDFSPKWAIKWSQSPGWWSIWSFNCVHCNYTVFTFRSLQDFPEFPLLPLRNCD